MALLARGRPGDVPSILKARAYLISQQTGGDGTGKEDNPYNGGVGYGSISYAGLLSLIYADLEKDDPRVKAVLEWLGRNYTLDENPGMGAQGLYYYYQAMAKSLVAARIDRLALAGGKSVDWRSELATCLLGKQQADGSWINENSRWWENNAVLVTSYVVLALEELYDSIPE
jgi:squalene-hopene/tetraprenyl-beta-curcumene cyclase